MKGFPELNKWKGNNLKWVYRDISNKPLEDKASKLHTIFEAMKTDEGSLMNISTILKGCDKRGFSLHVNITKHERYKHKENTHEQETDI